MREIKFRAWDKFNKVMTYSDKNYPLSKYSIEFNWKNKNKMSLMMLIDPRNGEMREFDADIMQYTGLKDKNGKEIYEGDIVEFYSNVEDEIITQEIEYYCGRYRAGDYHLGKIYSKCEVIGNIHENKELLS